MMTSSSPGTVERSKLASLTPQEMGVMYQEEDYIKKIACGQCHSFAVDMDGKIWARGFNNLLVRRGVGRGGQSNLGSAMPPPTPPQNTMLSAGSDVWRMSAMLMEGGALLRDDLDEL